MILAQQNLSAGLSFANASLGASQIIIAIIGPVYLLIMTISWWRIFQKANKPGAAVLIPVYNIILVLQIARKPWWYLFLLLIPPFTILLPLAISVELADAFNHSTEFGVSLWLLSIIFVPILAFDDSKYQYSNSFDVLPDITQDVEFLPPLE